MSIVAILLLMEGGRPRPRLFLLLSAPRAGAPALHLCLLRRSLRRLQRIDRRRTRKSAALSGRLLGFCDDDVPALRPRYTALNHQKILVLIYTEDTQVALRHAVLAHVSRHAHSLQHP